MPLTTSSTTSASRADAAQDGPGGTREDGHAAAHPVQLEVGREPLERRRAGIAPGDHRDPVAPGDPARHLAIEVRSRAAALGVRPIPVGQQQDVPRTFAAPYPTWERGYTGPHDGSHSGDAARRSAARRSPWFPPPPSGRARETTSTPIRSARTRKRRRRRRRRARPPPRRRPRPAQPAATPRTEPARPRRDARAPGPAPAVHGSRRLAARRRRGAPARRRPHAPRAASVSQTELTTGPEGTEAAGARARRPARSRATSCSSRASWAPGKTTFVRGALRSLGVDRSRSPRPRSSSAISTRAQTGPARAPRPL